MTAAAAAPADSNVNPLRVDRIVAHDLAGNTGNQRRFTSTAPLIARAKPVPAFRRVRLAGLCRIDDETGLFFGDEIHARAGGEIVRRLGAAVQHDYQRERLPVVAAGDGLLLRTA